MQVFIRKAEKKDINKITELLREVLELHAAIRPDIFVSGTTKYTGSELAAIIENEKTPVFVAEGDDGEVKGYAFCQIKDPPFSTNMRKVKSLFIDDLCVDENCRGSHVGQTLFSFVKKFANGAGCYDITLNVWAGNDNAVRFYDKMGMFVKETQMELILDK